MSNHALIPEVRIRNARALAAAIGINDIGQATQLLDLPILITASEEDAASNALANDVEALLSRTVTCVSRELSETDYQAEVVIGNALPRSNCEPLFVSYDQNGCLINSEKGNDHKEPNLPSILRRLVACYTSAAALKAMLGERLKYKSPLPMALDFRTLGIDLAALTSPIDIGRAYLAGAGAIGNGLIWGLQGLSLVGELHIVDPDQVDESNLQRQIFFNEEDIGLNKCEQLVANAQQSFPDLKLIPRHGRLQDLEDRKNDHAWLRKLIVAVDSRRARRILQDEVPGEVFDASTTGIEEVVIHYHRQPTEDACLACIYYENEPEQAFEAHVAEALGVSIDKVHQLAIDEEAAASICKRYPESFENPYQIIGMPYDTLFRSLCGEDKLKAGVGEKEVLTPFAFVSALAGIMLGLEIVRRHSFGKHDDAFNYWRISPWLPPIARLRRNAPRHESCQFCSSETKKSVAQMLWTTR